MNNSRFYSMNFMKRVFFVLLVMLYSLSGGSVLAFHGDGPLLQGILVLDKIQTGEATDKEYKVTGVNSEGYIQGTPKGENEKQKILFKDISKIEFSPSGHFYIVMGKDGKIVELTFGSLTTHYTSPTFDCMVWDEKEKKSIALMVSPVQIKSLVFEPSKSHPEIKAPPKTTSEENK